VDILVIQFTHGEMKNRRRTEWKQEAMKVKKMKINKNSYKWKTRRRRRRRRTTTNVKACTEMRNARI